MPIIEIKAFDRRFADPDTNAQLISHLTDAFCEVMGEEARAETWIVLQGVEPSKWGFAGEVRK